MNDEEKMLLRAQIATEQWAQLKYWISNGLCVGCGGEPTVKLFVHFCDDCLNQEGAEITFNNPQKSTEHPPPDSDAIGAEWMAFITKLNILEDKRQNGL